MSRWFNITDDSRSWEDFYRNRWSYDYSVRTGHGVNCSMSCSWEVFVKDGLICWELQKTDYPQIEADVPNVEPRGCQRGATASWYPYSPLRPKFPYVRKVLWEMYQGEMSRGKDPVEAWGAIVEDEKKSKKYKSARGKAGWKRVSWDEATELAAAAQIYTIKQYGADHIATFSPIPGMSLLSFIGGHRYNNLLGGIYTSYYDWYHDLPHVSASMWGDQTENCESSDWYHGTYWIIAGTNLNMTRTADAHFLPEAKYRGTKVVVVSPNYSDVAKYSDLWVPVVPGSDGAFFMACIHVILKEFFADRDTPYFTDYVKRFTNLPFLVVLEKDGNRYQMGRFLRASDVAEYANEENGDWKLLMTDAAGKLQLPTGSLGFRWEKEPTGNWNLKLENAVTQQPFDPLLTLLGAEQQRVKVSFSDFTSTFDIFLKDTEGAGSRAKELLREVPVQTIKTKDGSELVVTTAFDLLMAQAGVSRGLGGDYPKDYDDPMPYTPAWQEGQTGVSRNIAIQVGREFAENAEKTRGKSMVITGPGLQHWYHGASLYYRNLAVMLALCGCNGVNGGNFNHYVGTQHTRLHAAFVNLGSALDWQRPPRMQNTTSLWYFHTGQYRYDGMNLDTQWGVGAKQFSRYNHAADVNALAVRMGWLPFFPQVDKKNPLRLYEEAVKAGCKTDDEVKSWVLEKFKSGELEFAINDVEAPQNTLKVLTVYRGNLIGTSMRGQELALKHFLGTHHNALWEDEPGKGKMNEIEWRDPHIGKLDLLINLNIRMDSTANYADIVLPAAFWYEKYDVTFGDMHTFVHPLTPATDPPWEAKSDWDAFVALAAKFSELAKKHFPKPVKDIVFKALWMDTPEMMAQPMGEVKDWRRGECEPVPGKTFPGMAIVERDYTKVHERLISLGPLVCQPKGYGSKGQYTDLTPIVEEELKNNEVLSVQNGRVTFEKAQQACELILQISPELNGRLSHMFFKEMEKKVGLPLADMVDPVRERRVHYKDIISQPRRIHTTPQWAAMLFDPETGKQRTFGPWTMNLERLKPWHTLSGRQEIYYDHRGIRELGEGLPTNKPPLDMVALGDVRMDQAEEGSKLFRFITPHGKWQIHSSFRDHWPMLHMSRGGPTVWLNPDDAAEIGVADNDWVELYCENGIEVVRAVTSHQVPKLMAVTYHQVERHINVPFSPLAKKRGCSDLRGGNNNATTRILMNPATMVGGYAQFSFYANFWGPSPSERDHCVLIRKMPAAGDKAAIYKEEELHLLPAR